MVSEGDAAVVPDKDQLKSSRLVVGASSTGEEGVAPVCWIDGKQRNAVGQGK